MAELTEAKYCEFYGVQKTAEEDMECEKCEDYKPMMSEPNPFKCKYLIFLRWWTDEIQSSEGSVI
jgi:hypothetical protein